VTVDTGALSPIALPAVVQISGTANDPSGKLTHDGDGGVTDPTFLSQAVNCITPADELYDESSYGTFFFDVPSYKFFVRQGISCAESPGYWVSMPGGTPGVTRENTAAVLLQQGASRVISANSTGEALTVPSVGTPIKMSITVRDARGVLLSNRSVRAFSESLVDGNLTGYQLRTQVVTDISGTVDLHLLPGTYSVSVFK
jgi:hypothetical protein